MQPDRKVGLLGIRVQHIFSHMGESDIAGLFDGREGFWFEADGADVYVNHNCTNTGTINSTIGGLLDKSQGLSLAGWDIIASNTTLSVLAANDKIIDFTNIVSFTGDGVLTISGSNWGFSFSDADTSESRYIELEVEYSNLGGGNVYLTCDGNLLPGSESISSAASGTLKGRCRPTDSNPVRFGGSANTTCTVDSIKMTVVLGNHAFQSSSFKRPTLRNNGGVDYLEATSSTADFLEIAIPFPGIVGTMIFSCRAGTFAIEVTYPLSSTAYTVDIGGGDSSKRSSILAEMVGHFLINRTLTINEKTAIMKRFISLGGGPAYFFGSDFTDASSMFSNLSEGVPPELDFRGVENMSSAFAYYGKSSAPVLDTSSVTDMSSVFQNSDIQEVPDWDFSNVEDLSKAWSGTKAPFYSFPTIDLSSVLDLSGTWQDAAFNFFNPLELPSCLNLQFAWSGLTGLNSFPLMTWPVCTDFRATWRNCTSLRLFPANAFDNASQDAQFDQAFTNTDLNQTSINRILVSIETIGSSNKRFDQSGGSAPSGIGEAAIDALRARGWTVNVTGGY